MLGGQLRCSALPSTGRLPLRQGGKEKKIKEKTQQNINSFVYTMPLLSGNSLALKQGIQQGNPVGTKFERGSVLPSKQQF